MRKRDEFKERIKNYRSGFHPVVPFDKEKDKLLRLDFTQKNKALTEDLLKDTTAFSRYITTLLEKEGATYGIGGYDEHRTIYSRSDLFSPGPSLTLPFREGTGTSQTLPGNDTENNHETAQSEDSAVAIPSLKGGVREGLRRLHLGTDIWGRVHTKVMAPLNGIVHSFAFNNGFGDYGDTIILAHNIEGFTFYTLYGHLSLNSIKNLQEGKNIYGGDVFAEFGPPSENGQWPPHLHFQIILDMEGYKGDYPGVCAFSEREKYLGNCPDPDLVLQMLLFAKEV